MLRTVTHVPLPPIGWMPVLFAMQLTENAPFSSWGQLVVFLIAVGMVVNWIWKFVKDKRTNGIPKAVSRVEPMLERLEHVVDTQTISLAGLTTSLGALNSTITLLGERLTNIPTRLDLQKAAEENRHALRNILTEVQANILEALRELKP